jgi:hypothetical protein
MMRLLAVSLDVPPKPEMQRRDGRFRRAGHVFEVDDLRLVHRAVPKSALVRRLIQDHGILHVVACVRDYRDDGVGAVRE